MSDITAPVKEVTYERTPRSHFWVISGSQSEIVIFVIWMFDVDDIIRWVIWGVLFLVAWVIQFGRGSLHVLWFPSESTWEHDMSLQNISWKTHRFCRLKEAYTVLFVLVQCSLWIKTLPFYDFPPFSDHLKDNIPTLSISLHFNITFNFRLISFWLKWMGENPGKHCNVI